MKEGSSGAAELAPWGPRAVSAVEPRARDSVGRGSWSRARPKFGRELAERVIRETSRRARYWSPQRSASSMSTVHLRRGPPNPPATPCPPSTAN